MAQKTLIFLLLVLFTVESKDLGVFGETFKICERDLLEQIFAKLRVLQDTGQLKYEQKKITERIKNMVLHPQQIIGITHTQHIREYTFNPTIMVTRDLSDHRGQVFAKKGEEFNPLDKVKMSKPLLFINGDEEEQIQWATLKIKDNPFAKIILIKGSPLDLQKRLNHNVYFDQHGLLTSKFGIEHVPAIVFQKSGEKVLTIIEEVISGEGK